MCEADSKALGLLGTEKRLIEAMVSRSNKSGIEYRCHYFVKIAKRIETYNTIARLYPDMAIAPLGIESLNGVMALTSEK